MLGILGGVGSALIFIFYFFKPFFLNTTFWFVGSMAI
jgi:hypothetical protein